MRQTKEIVFEVKECLKFDKSDYISKEDIISMGKFKTEEIYKLWRVIEILEFENIITKENGEFLWRNNFTEREAI